MEKLQERYFAQFDKLPKEYAKHAKKNFNLELAKDNHNPKNTEEAIFNGIDWMNAEKNFQFWNQLHNSLINKEKIE